jgi:hypothetical protein
MNSQLETKIFMVIHHSKDKIRAEKIIDYLSKKYPNTNFSLKCDDDVKPGFLHFMDKKWLSDYSALLMLVRLELNDEFPYKRYRYFFTEYF